jgi:tetratricopeptide (TPR) repeat protein
LNKRAYMDGTPPNCKYDVFLSYRRGGADESFARDLLKRLETDGYLCAMDTRDFVSNIPFLDEMERCVRESRFTVCVISARYLESGNCVEEAVICKVLDMAERRRRLLPLVLESVVLPTWCHLITGIDTTEKDPLIGWYDKLKRDIGPPAVAPPHIPGQFWNVPPRNPYFTGRDDILAAIGATLESGGAAVLNQAAEGHIAGTVQAMSGLGGIGKTQTAIEYAHRQRTRYTAVLWARAESPTTLAGSFSEIARALSLPEADAQDQSVTVASVTRWLREHEGWLLILDNVEDLDAVQAVVPSDLPGHVLITTRRDNLRKLGIKKPLGLPEMPPEEARDFLFKTYRCVRTAAEESDAEQLAVELGGLPLALEQAAAYMHENDMSFRDYLVSYLNLRLSLLEAGRPEVGGYRDTVRVTWKMNIEAVRKESEAAADLLTLAAFLAPEAVPYEILTAGAPHLGGPLAAALADAAENPSALNTVLTPLARYSLIRRDNAERVFTVHRLVQAVVRESLDAAQHSIWAERAVLSVNAAFPKVEFSNWPLCSRLLSHAQACAVHIEDDGIITSKAARLLNAAGCYLDDRAEYAAAELLYKRALAIYETILGSDHPSTATSLNNLALLYNNQGDFAAAEPLYKRAIVIREKTQGPEHPALATSLNNLAALYHDQGDNDSAKPLYMRALAIDEKTYGLDHPEVGTDLNNLAELYRAEGDHAAAEPLYMRALAIEEMALGPEHPSTATILNNLAALYYDQGDYAAAEPLTKRALAIVEKALRPEHPDTSLSQRNYSILLRKLGRDAEAAEWEARAALGRAAHEAKNRRPG